MGGKAPKCVITDGDSSMANAIRRVFPDARHKLCRWHLLHNATGNVGSKNFTSDFQYCMCADIEIDEFEERWEKLKSDNGVQFNDWVSDLYEMKEKWTTAYIRGEFYAGLTTTSRCEGLHAQVGRYVESGYTLTEFIHHFQQCLSYIRWGEVSADHVSQVGEPVLKTQLVELERIGASVYTHEIFKMFQLVLKSAES
ncbi:hypothetical protein RIF29_00566 [Crotalaria pallida]|uniref:Protein FAR1-RELATED SEQUENCE n=1 Tax=Crotalaria pallida TaxID=3830 RepID=A0AAN9IW90_CROPI